MAGLPSITSAAGQVLSRTLFIQTNTPSGIPIPLIVMDAITEEKPSYSAEITDHPVESGTEISDHFQPKPVMLRLKGKISSTPIDAGVAIANVLAGGYQAFTNSQFRSNLLNSGVSQGIGLVGASLQGKSQNIGASAASAAMDSVSRSILLTVYSNGIPFDVVTKRQRFSNMLIANMSFPRTDETGYSLDFEMELKQLRIVSPNKVLKTQTSEDVISSAASSTNVGAQATQQASTQTTSAISDSNLSSIPGMSSKFPGLFA